MPEMLHWNSFDLPVKVLTSQVSMAGFIEMPIQCQEITLVVPIGASRNSNEVTVARYAKFLQTTGGVRPGSVGGGERRRRHGVAGDGGGLARPRRLD